MNEEEIEEFTNVLENLHFDVNVILNYFEAGRDKPQDLYILRDLADNYQALLYRFIYEELAGKKPDETIDDSEIYEWVSGRLDDGALDN